MMAKVVCKARLKSGDLRCGRAGKKIRDIRARLRLWVALLPTGEERRRGVHDPLCTVGEAKIIDVCRKLSRLLCHEEYEKALNFFSSARSMGQPRKIAELRQNLDKKIDIVY